MSDQAVLEARSDNLLQLAAEGEFDYLDYGCSNGASLDFGRGVLGGKRGLGLDLAEDKIAEARKRGLEACVADLTSVALPKNCVSFVTMLHFLEHLPASRMAERCIHLAVNQARDFVFIRHPWFDGDYQLMKHGLKAFWSDWKGHHTHFGALNFRKLMQRDTSIRGWTIFGVKRITSTRSTALIDLGAPRNSSHADEADVAARDDIPLGFDMFYEVGCLIEIGPHFDAGAILGKIKGLEVLLEGRTGY